MLHLLNLGLFSSKAFCPLSIAMHLLPIASADRDALPSSHPGDPLTLWVKPATPRLILPLASITPKLSSLSLTALLLPLSSKVKSFLPFLSTISHSDCSQCPPTAIEEREGTLSERAL